MSSTAATSYTLIGSEARSSVLHNMSPGRLLLTIEVSERSVPRRGGAELRAVLPASRWGRRKDSCTDVRTDVRTDVCTDICTDL